MNIHKLLEQNIKDPSLLRTLQDIVNEKVAKRVTCLECNNVVAYVYVDGKVKPAVEDGVMHLFAFRNRLDGYMGFQCDCGNDSRLCKQEIGNAGVEGNTITKEDIEQILSLVERMPSDYPIVQGKQIVDNFLIEDI